MKKQFIFSVIAAGLFLGACQNRSTQQNEGELANDSSTVIADTTAYADNSQTSLDWAGTYSGTLPCADCEGIKTTITINQDGKFERKSEYLGKGDNNIFDEKGTFTWDSAGRNIITKIGTETYQYKVGEGFLQQLDQEGNEITGNLADHYILKKK
ncbi:copper resistance protein NlpE [Pseudopedobacter beijingensis]|uniref:Copper resistance protein NlpE n=1 Tax=Pseudopedobacter beijingensis TaxID=1207056 RepID=A0ABW4IGG1_9SPHI